MLKQGVIMTLPLLNSLSIDVELSCCSGDVSPIVAVPLHNQQLESYIVGVPSLQWWSLRSLWPTSSWRWGLSSIHWRFCQACSGKWHSWIIKHCIIRPISAFTIHFLLVSWHSAWSGWSAMAALWFDPTVAASGSRLGMALNVKMPSPLVLLCSVTGSYGAELQNRECCAVSKYNCSPQVMLATLHICTSPAIFLWKHTHHM